MKFQVNAMRTLSPRAVLVARRLISIFRDENVPPTRDTVRRLRDEADHPERSGACGTCEGCKACIEALRAIADDLEMNLDAYGVDDFRLAGEHTTKDADGPFVAPMPKLAM